MKCEDARRNLVAYLDHDLDQPSTEELESHLGECAACASELESLKATVKLLTEESPPEPPESVLVNLLPRVRMRLEERRRARTQLLPRFVYLSAAAVVVVAALLLFRTGRGPQEVPVPVAENGPEWVSLVQELVTTVDVEAVELVLLEDEPALALLGLPEWSEGAGELLGEGLRSVSLDGMEESLQEESGASVSDLVEELDESEMEELVADIRARWGKQ